MCCGVGVSVFLHVLSPLLGAGVLPQPTGVDERRPGSGCHVGNGRCLRVAQRLWFVGNLSKTHVHSNRMRAAQLLYVSPAESLGSICWSALARSKQLLILTPTALAVRVHQLNNTSLALSTTNSARLPCFHGGMAAHTCW